MKTTIWHEITNLGSTKVNDIQNTLKNANVALMAEWSYNALQKLQSGKSGNYSLFNEHF